MGEGGGGVVASKCLCTDPTLSRASIHMEA